jgi:heme exporter protein A
MKLELDKVVVERGGRALFSPRSITVASGTLLHVRGANGAGKTSLLRVLTGLSAVSEGAVVWSQDNVPVAQSAASTFVGHANAMNEALTVVENLTYAASLSGLNVSPMRIGLALEQLGVFKLALRRVGTLSQGQRKRAALARLLLGEQRGLRAWLLDEPFVALDVDTQEILERLIASELQAGAIVVLTSHQPFSIDAVKKVELEL